MLSAIPKAISVFRPGFVQSYGYIHRLLLGMVLVIVLLLASCQVEEENSRVRFGQLYLDTLTEQSVSERNFIEVSYEKLFTIPDTASIFLYRPVPASVDSHGNLYAIDWGPNLVLKFSPSGEHLVSYGEEGLGKGPGELLHITDFGITIDSVVYVVDSYGFKVAFFSIDGAFLQEKKASRQPYAYQIADTGREYLMFANGLPLLESRLDDDVIEIISSSDLVDEGENGSMGLKGHIVTYNGNVLYVFSQYPLILQYAPDGTLLYARTTIGYDDSFEEPKIKTLMLGGMSARRNIARDFHVGPTTIDDHKLYVVGVSPSEAPDKTAAIDVYDVGTGDYLHSMFMPEDGHFYTIYQNGRIYQEKDTTIVAWKVVY